MATVKERPIESALCRPCISVAAAPDEESCYPVQAVGFFGSAGDVLSFTYIAMSPSLQEQLGRQIFHALNRL